MLPEKHDARWRSFVCGPQVYPLTNLAARMLFTRVRLMSSRKDEAVIKDAIGIAYDFFAKNTAIAAADIKTIFG